MGELPHKLEKMVSRLNGQLDEKIKKDFYELINHSSKLSEKLSLRNHQFESMKQTIHSKKQFGFIYSQNLQMQKMFKIAQMYKDSDEPILLSGKKGSGKEAFARAIHLTSTKKGDFLIFDKTQSVESLMASEQATIYFPEVSIWSTERQKALALAFKTKPASRTRIIASCEAPAHLLPSVLKEFKSLILEILPLHDRKEDVLPLIDTFIREFSRNEKNISNFSPSALTKLVEYSWPGNTSELKLEIKRILIDHWDERHYSLQHLPEKIVGSSLRELFSIIDNNDLLPDAVDTLERKMVIEALMKHQWNKSKVSRELGISRSGLIQKVQKYKIHRLHKSQLASTKPRMSDRNSSFMSVN